VILTIGENVPHEVDTLARESTVKCMKLWGQIYGIVVEVSLFSLIY
jgi:hypothetical protein